MFRLLKKIIFISILVLSSTSQGAAKKISSSDALLLTPLFRLLLQEVEAGYVLYDKKPVCLISYSAHPFFFESFEPFDQLSTAIYCAHHVLEQPCFHSGNILFHFNDKDELLLIINRKLFTKTVNENLSLFQYVLGPSITAETLLTTILTSHHEFFEVLHYDRTLIGIILGYGTQNALYDARLETIETDAIFTCDLPPFLPHHTLTSDLETKSRLLFLNKNEISRWQKPHSTLNPSLGFSSLKEEAEEITKKIATSSKQLLAETPQFVFSRLKESKANTRLLSVLESTQKKIQKLINSPNFLVKSLELICGEKIIIEKVLHPTFPTSVEDLDYLIAKLLKAELQTNEKHALASFADGLLSKNDSYIVPALEGPSSQEEVNNIRIARNNLLKADHFFEALDQNPDYRSLKPHVLYYKILEEGSGIPLHEEKKISVSFEVYDPLHKCLNCGTQDLELKTTLQGFAHGIQGMKVGEKRRIYIHPSVGFGVHTYLEKGIYLEAIVTLHKIYEGKETLSPLIPMDLSFIRDKEFVEQCEKEYANTLRFIGRKKADFLRLCRGIDIPSVAKVILTLDDLTTLSQGELDILNQYFWKLYF